MPNPVSKNDLKVYRGDTFHYEVLWRDEAGDPIDITGSSAKLQIRINHRSEDAILTLTDGDGLTINGANGQVDIDMTAEQTEIETLDNVYDLELVLANGDVVTLMQGKLTIYEDVTR